MSERELFRQVAEHAADFVDTLDTTEDDVDRPLPAIVACADAVAPQVSRT